MPPVAPAATETAVQIQAAPPALSQPIAQQPTSPQNSSAKLTNNAVAAPQGAAESAFPSSAPQSIVPSVSTAGTAATAIVSEPAVEQPPKHRVNVTQNPKPLLQKVEQVRVQPAESPQQPGWSCQAGGEKQNWNCNLVGPDPRGQEQEVTDTGFAWHLLTPAFSHSQESTFQTLRGEFKQDPWLNCGNWSIRKPKKKAALVDRENAVTDVMADSSETFEGEVLSFSGNVDLTRADQHLLADKASYDTGADTMDAQGHVIYSEGSIAMAGDTATMGMSSSEAKLRRAMFMSADGPLRGSADAINRYDENLTRYNDAAFTSCAPGNQDWVMHTSRLKINKDSGQGSAKNAWLEFKGAPIIYTPYISFPTDSRRLSGFLSPTWGNTQRSGFYASAPYYWNIAPNVDTTLTPRYFSERGEMLSNNLRYLTPSSKGVFGVEFMPHDQLLSKPRYSFSFKDKSTILPGLTSVLDLNRVSDSTYFTDLNTALGFNRSSYLPSTAVLNYARQDVAFTGSMYHYQAVDPTISSNNLPYDVLPRLNLSLNHNFEGMPLRLQMENQFSSFQHSVLVNGERLVLWPSISTPFESSAGFFIPRASVQSTQYQLSKQVIAGQPASINRTLPIISLDTGMFIEKSMDFDGTPYSNVIEPRLFYLYIPRKDQRDIPVFDTSAFDTNFNSLFRENSYSGYDRLQDANQLTLAATSRYINNKTGLEPVKASLGTIFYFQNRTVTLPLPGTLQQSTNPNDYIQVQTAKTSNIVGEVSGQLNQNLSYSTGAQWNEANNSLARGQAVLKIRNQTNQLFDIGYRYRSASANPLVPSAIVPGTTNLPATISLADISFRWPLFDQWYALGRWQYSLNFDKTMESFIGLEKENCCWRFRVIGRRYINGATTSTYVASNVEPQTAFFVELELKGLSGIGDDVDYFLQTTLNGYRSASYFNN